jgi:uncharacterized protein YbaR (Trm112 family)
VTCSERRDCGGQHEMGPSPKYSWMPCERNWHNAAVDLQLLICPVCRAPTLEGTHVAIRCATCERAFPCLSGIPVLFPDAHEKLALWSGRLNVFLSETEGAVRQLLAQSVAEGLLPRTRTRLVAVGEGLRAHASRVHALFSQAGLELNREPASKSTGDPILAYYTLVHRDWAWAPEVDEVAPAIDALIDVLPAGFQLGRTLVLGAGTARLAWDLGNRVAGALDVVALDVNPLPFLVTKQLMAGRELSLFELPGHPRRSTFASVERLLKATTQPPPGLRLVLADGLDPPVLAGQFDTVITPWFVDQVPENLASLPALIRRVLRPGGAWLNQGPFVYDPVRTKPAHRYCADEFVQIVNTSGFAISKATYLPYSHMASPLSGQARSEWVLSMHAVATGAEATPEEPPWLSISGDELPIPRLPGLGDYATPHSSIAAVARLIDGKTSNRKITQELVATGELAGDGADEVVRGCLRVIWNDLARKP